MKSINILIKSFLFSVVVFLLSNTAVFSQQKVFDINKINKDTTVVNPKKTSKYTTLKSVNYLIHILPPTKNFTHIGGNMEFGIESKTDNAKITLRFQASHTFNYVDSIFMKSANHYKEALLDYRFFKSHEMLFKGMKYISLFNNDTMVTWNMICGNNYCGVAIYATYPLSKESKIGDAFTKTITSIIFEKNPEITPEYNVPFTCDYSILDLKFFQKTGIAAIFTEDGESLELTKGTKCFFATSIPPSQSQADNLADNVIDLLNNTFLGPYLKDSIYASKVLETEIQQQKGLQIEGGFKNHDTRVFVIYMAATMGSYNIVMGYCEEDEKDLFFEKIRKFMKDFRYN